MSAGQVTAKPLLIKGFVWPPVCGLSCGATIAAYGASWACWSSTGAICRNGVSAVTAASVSVPA